MPLIPASSLHSITFVTYVFSHQSTGLGNDLMMSPARCWTHLTHLTLFLINHPQMLRILPRARLLSSRKSIHSLTGVSYIIFAISIVVEAKSQGSYYRHYHDHMHSHTWVLIQVWFLPDKQRQGRLFLLFPISYLSYLNQRVLSQNRTWRGFVSTVGYPWFCMCGHGIQSIAVLWTRELYVF